MSNKNTARSRLPTSLSNGALLAVLMISFCWTIFATTPAKACGPCDSEWNAEQVGIFENYDSNLQTQTQTVINEHTTLRFLILEDWLLNNVFLQRLLPAFAMMTEQISASALHQMEIIGTFLDAKHQMETQRLFQQMNAQTHKDYAPSEGLCTIGTMTRSLAASERNVDVSALVLNERSMDRQLLNLNTAASEGRNSDQNSRFVQFQRRYCDKRDNGNNLNSVCTHDPAVPLETINRDVDFYRTLSKPLTLDMDLTNGTITNDETDIFALQANLYAHDVPASLSPSAMRDPSVLQAYLDKRAVVAKRGVAETSFQTIAAMKSAGQTSNAVLTTQYMTEALKEMGISAADAATLIGANPSYYAQMDLLTRKIFQRPEFFIDLYDKPVNVERKSVALQAISLMQRRDLFKSALRTESMLSLLLELEVAEAQKNVQNQLDRLK